MKPIEVYEYYQSLNLHFKKDKYDHFKYKGAIRNPESAYNKFNDFMKYQFKKVADMREPRIFIAGNFIFGDETFIGNFKEDPYLEFRRCLVNGEYLLKEDLDKIKKPFSTNFYVDTQNQIPYILRALISGQISMFTACVFQRLGNWTQKFNDNFIVAPYVFKINKSYRFFKIDETKFKKLIIENNK